LGDINGCHAGQNLMSASGDRSNRAATLAGWDWEWYGSSLDLVQPQNVLTE
jgi:hypothetical protein